MEPLLHAGPGPPQWTAAENHILKGQMPLFFLPDSFCYVFHTDLMSFTALISVAYFIRTNQKAAFKQEVNTTQHSRDGTLLFFSAKEAARAVREAVTGRRRRSHHWAD